MVTEIARADLIRLLDSERPQIVDVLSSREYEESHLPGATSLPLARIGLEAVSALDRDRPIAVYCHDGL